MTALVRSGSYTLGIYAEGYIVFVFMFINSCVCVFVCSFLY